MTPEVRNGSRRPPAERELQARLRRHLAIQGALVLVVAALTWVWRGEQAALAAAFGYAMSVLNSTLLHWHLLRAQRWAGADPQRNMRIFYRCALERFVATVTLFALGIGVWRLPAMPLLGAFIIGQFAQHVSGIHKKLETGKHG